MKKLYMPTSTLNFNNILSSESISPKAFYAQREFGYSRWTKIPENNIDTVTLLYEKPFRFVRPASDMEDHPMLVEICTDEEFPSIKNGIFYTDHTIYLSPWRTKFIFFSEQDRRIVLSISDSSLETKLISAYRSCMLVEENMQISLFQDNNDYPHIELNAIEIERDYRLNKMKGLLYGYYIGSLLSVSSETTRKYNILQELQSVFSVILSSELHELTDYQNMRLNALLAELQKTQPVISFLRSKLANPQEIEEVINQCVRLGTIFPDIINKRSIIDALKYPSQEDNFALNWLNKEWNKLKLQTRKERKLLSVSSEEIVVVDCLLGKIINSFVLDSKENEVTKAWVNTIFLSKAYNGKTNLFKKELSDAVTIKAKEVYGEQWEISRNKQALNQMRRYVQGQKSSFEWNNYLTSSIAAVIAKGDDWNKLLDFMRSKGMSDYRLAFAFYGELNGFANLTRDFTDNLFELEDKQYVADVYTELYGQLLGESPLLSNQDPDIKDLSALGSVNSVQDQIIAVLPQIENICKRTFTEDLKKDLMCILAEYKGSQNPLDFIEHLASSSSKWSRKLKVWKELKKMFSSDNKKKQNEYGQTCFNFLQIEKESPKNKLFYDDSNAWNIIKDLVSEFAKDKLKDDLKWFQEELQKPKDERKFFKQINVNNNSQTIEQFCHLKEQEKNGKPQAPYFTKELREQIKQRLLSYYVNK